MTHHGREAGGSGDSLPFYFLFSIYFFYLFGKLLVTQMKVRARILVYDTEMVSPKKAGQIGVGDEEWRSIGEIT